MPNRAPDDIFALFSRFGLDGDEYQIFHAETAASAMLPAATATSTMVLEEVPAPAEVVSTDLQCPRVEVVAGPVLASDAPLWAHREPTPIQSESDTSRTSLQGLWRHLANSRNSKTFGPPEALATNCISVTGVAGGVGTTTVAAILTRLLAKAGHRCGLFDDTDDPTLPIYFGAQTVADEQRRFAGLRSIFESRARILNRRMFDTVNSVDAPQSFLERHSAAIAQNFDHVVFDRPARSLDCSGATVKIHVAVPDLSSLARVQKVRRDLDAFGNDDSTICVLNRFDASMPLHKEVLGWYRDNFRHLAVIRESSLVTEALAEATTVVDWIPESPVSGDFLALFAAVRQSLGTASERLPLCS
jgi:cellulose biosynthesis protein BcsQ